MHAYTHSKEASVILLSGMVRAVLMAFYQGFAIPLIVFIVIVSFASAGGVLLPRRVFTVLSLVIFIRRITIAFVVRSVLSVSDGLVGFNRVQVNNVFILSYM